jgi:hypothetical protein
MRCKRAARGFGSRVLRLEFKNFGRETFIPCYVFASFANDIPSPRPLTRIRFNALSG